ncbi:MAG TPA: hypothetical protein VLM79_07950 [Kofleriaceae bacterium]|nr:hypothetical protein [Kofleriaceae bacterium]
MSDRGRIAQHRNGHRCSGSFRGSAVEDHGEAEVEQLCAAVVGQHRVRRLDVAMENAAAVSSGEPTRQVECDIQDVLRRHRPLELMERATLDVLRDQIRMTAEVGDSIDRNDIGMLKARNRARLFDQPRTGRRVLACMYELHCDRPLEE